ncbi:putative 4-coumarate--CoA ligase 1 [Haemaphysalis longicornis]
MGSVDGYVSATDFTALDESDFQECPIVNPKDAVMALFYTSGTTGLPKGAEVTHYNFVACFYVACRYMPWSDQDISLGTNPIAHISGLVFILMPVINGSSCVVVSATAAPQEMMDAIDKYHATAMVVFPAHLHALVAQMRLEGRRLPSMRHVVVGGNVLHGMLSDAACSIFESIQTLRNIYGMTETCIVCTSQEQHDHILKRGNDVGLPLVTTSFKIVDVETGERLGPNKMGEIRIRNASMVRGYYKRPMESAELFDKEGWMKTGDAGYYDEDGRLYFAERLKQLIKCMNNQVVPRELEELLLRAHEDDIAQVSILGLPQGEYGEVAAAAIVLTEKGRQKDPLDLADRIKATVRERLAMYKHLHGGVFFLDSFPTTVTSKINRAALTRLIADMR